MGSLQRTSAQKYLFVGTIAGLFLASAMRFAICAPPVAVSPVLGYSTYLGGSGFDVATDVAVDSNGDVYVTGYTNSPGLASSGVAQGTLGGGTCGSGEDTYPCFDAFVAKFDPTGRKLVYVTYFGGSGGEYATGIAVDSAGNAYVTGYTNSIDLPTASAFQSSHGGGTCGGAANSLPCFDTFVAKLDPTGSTILFLTYLGGSADDLAQGIAVNTQGSVTLSGFTASPDFPVRAAVLSSFAGGDYDSFVTQLDSNGALVFSTFLGGAGDDFGTRVAVDGAGNIYLTGYTNSADFPVLSAVQSAHAAGTCGALSSTTACFDPYVAKLKGDGSKLEYSTYLGGTGGDHGYGIAVDAAGSAFVTGLTTSIDYPVTFGALDSAGGGSNTDAFVAKLDPSGAALVYSTYLGGIGAEAGNGIAVDEQGQAYVAGYAYGGGLPLADPLQPANAGYYDAFLAKLNESGSALEFSTYLGGMGNETARAVAVDAHGNAYVVGETFSDDFPLKGPVQPGYAGGAFDAFVAKVALGDSPFLHVSPTEVTFGNQLVGTESTPQTITLTNTGSSSVELSSIAVLGEFTQSNDCPGSMEVGASCSINVSFFPAGAGSRIGSLIITNTIPEETKTASLAGMGTNFSLSATPAEISIPAGGSAAYTLTLNPIGGFQGTVALTCAGAPKAATCSVAPSSITLDGESPTTARVAVTTQAGAAGGPNPESVTPRRHPDWTDHSAPAVWISIALLLIVVVGLCRVPWQLIAGGAHPAVLPTALLTLILLAPACGGGRASSPSTRVGGTPPGTYALTVTGTFDGVSRSTTVTLKIN